MGIHFGDFSCIVTALVFYLGNLDMVLGMDWLNTLGEVLHNRKENSMWFQQGNKWVELKASSSVRETPVPLKV